MNRSDLLNVAARVAVVGWTLGILTIFGAATQPNPLNNWHLYVGVLAVTSNAFIIGGWFDDWRSRLQELTAPKLEAAPDHGGRFILERRDRPSDSS